MWRLKLIRVLDQRENGKGIRSTDVKEKKRVFDKLANKCHYYLNKMTQSKSNALNELDDNRIKEINGEAI